MRSSHSAAVAVVRAQSKKHLCGAERLIRENYRRQGYGEDHTIPAGAITLVALDGETVIGTMSVLLAGSQATITRLAIAPTAPGVTVLRALYAAAAEYRAENPTCRELAIEVHTRHRRFYERLGFIAGETSFNSAIGAPTIAMLIDTRACGWRGNPS